MSILNTVKVSIKKKIKQTSTIFYCSLDTQYLLSYLSLILFYKIGYQIYTN
jgi:hypothetical protein